MVGYTDYSSKVLGCSKLVIRCHDYELEITDMAPGPQSKCNSGVSAHAVLL